MGSNQWGSALITTHTLRFTYPIQVSNFVYSVTSSGSGTNEGATIVGSDRTYIEVSTWQINRGVYWTAIGH